jgi:hypothetical protein
MPNQEYINESPVSPEAVFQFFNDLPGVTKCRNIVRLSDDSGGVYWRASVVYEPGIRVRIASTCIFMEFYESDIVRHFEVVGGNSW